MEDMTLEQALENTGFEKCEFNLDPEETCDRCDEHVDYPIQEKIKENFFEDLKEWRLELTQAIAIHNQNIPHSQIEYFAQKILNRLIFIDYCSDNRIISQDRLHAVLESKTSIYSELLKIFLDMDEKFNSELFAPSKIDELVIPDKILTPIINGLAAIDFSRLSVHVIGEVYEKYLSKIQRSGQGIYYTPEHIIDYVVLNTVGSVLSKCKTIEELEKIKVLDPACGSGSFLIRIFDEFLKNYKRFRDYTLFEFELRKKILVNNIYGVDLDDRAIEIAKLNLLVKALEGAAHFNINGRKILPNIKLNIRCGNSLVSGTVATKDMSLFWSEYSNDLEELVKQHEIFLKSQDDDEQDVIYDQILIIEETLNRKLDANLSGFSDLTIVKPFNYEVSFPTVFKNGGFNCVIGNPPYIDSEAMTKDQPETRLFCANNMNFTKGNWDIYIAFFEKAKNLTLANGYFGYITPDKWISKPFGEEFRKNTCNNIVSLMRAGKEVFKDAKVDSVVSIYQNKKVTDIIVLEALPDSIQLTTQIKKTKLKPSYEYDFLFSKYIDLIARISDKANASDDLVKCENACATSDCYLLKEILEDYPTTNVDLTKYYKILNTGVLSKYTNRWGIKPMKYLKDNYINPVVNKEKFHELFSNSYGKKANIAKLIVKSLTLLDASIDSSGEYIPAKSTLVITTRNNYLSYISSVINSKLAFFYISQKYPSSSYNGGITFTKAMINNFPFIEPSVQILNKMNALVAEVILETEKLHNIEQYKIQKQERIVQSVQREIDKEVYKMYELTSIDIEIIEANQR
jgi:methylase of polypeptide subunit release factors